MVMAGFKLFEAFILRNHATLVPLYQAFLMNQAAFFLALYSRSAKNIFDMMYEDDVNPRYFNFDSFETRNCIEI